MSKTILIGGGTGLVGNRLSEILFEKGYEIIHLSRKKNLNKKFPAYAWNLSSDEIDEEAIKKADAVINLAGAGIADALWTKKRKKLIIESRTKSTLLLKNAFERLEKPPNAFISAAAIGYYGDRGEELMTEEKKPSGMGFLSQSCIEWEKTLDEVKKTGWRTARVRIGIVLSTKGGALEKIILPVKFRIGGYFGSGEQWYSWIHTDDLCRMFIYLLENKDLSGTFNGVAPHPERNRILTQKIGQATGKPPFMIPAPEFAMRLAMGEMADTIFSSTKVSSKKIQTAGFKFKFPTLTEAVKDLVKRKI